MLLLLNPPQLVDLIMLVLLYLVVSLRKSDYQTIHKQTVTTHAQNSIMLEIAQVDWSLLSHICDLYILIESYQDIVTTIYHKHCPIRRLCMKTDSKPAW